MKALHPAGNMPSRGYSRRGQEKVLVSDRGIPAAIRLKTLAFFVVYSMNLGFGEKIVLEVGGCISNWKELYCSAAIARSDIKYLGRVNHETMRTSTYFW